MAHYQEIIKFTNNIWWILHVFFFWIFIFKNRWTFFRKKKNTCFNCEQVYWLLLSDLILCGWCSWVGPRTTGVLKDLGMVRIGHLMLRFTFTLIATIIDQYISTLKGGRLFNSFMHEHFFCIMVSIHFAAKSTIIYT